MNALHRRIAAAVLVASLVVLVLVLVPATAGAATQTSRFSISGTEVSATSTTGRFVGAASGSALGTWYAEVVHAPLSGGDGAQAAIGSGGSFGMALAQAEPAYVVSGQSPAAPSPPSARAQTAPIRSTRERRSQERVGDRDRPFLRHADAPPKVGPRPVLALCGDGQRHRHAGLIAGIELVFDTLGRWGPGTTWTLAGRSRRRWSGARSCSASTSPPSVSWPPRSSPISAPTAPGSGA